MYLYIYDDYFDTRLRTHCIYIALIYPSGEYICVYYINIIKANLRELIAAIGLVISNWIQIVNFSTRVTVKFDG